MSLDSITACCDLLFDFLEEGKGDEAGEISFLVLTNV
jgi:hypothetical protein